MMNLLGIIVKRIFSLILTLFITTAVLFAGVTLASPQARFALFITESSSANLSDTDYSKAMHQIALENHLNASFPVQYISWVANLLKGNWGYSNSLNENVLQAIIRRTPVTAELTLYSVLLFIPLGLLFGGLSGSRENSLIDHSFRISAYIATSLPPFILALVLLAFFYIGLYWFPPGRLSDSINQSIVSGNFRTFTGMLTIDGLLNGRLDVTLDALRHLVLPIITLTLAHWATLGRITRASMIEERQQDYTVAARSRGISENSIVWNQMFPNAVPPALTSSILSTASLLTGVFVVEIIFNLHGISDIAVSSMKNAFDTPAAMGFTIYSVIVVYLLMTLLDILQSLIDPRIRKGMQ